MKPNKTLQKRWIELLEKHKDELSIENLEKVRKMLEKNDNSWEVFDLKARLLCLEYPLKGEKNGRN